MTEPHLLYAYAQKLARLINHPLFKKEWVCRYPSLPGAPPPLAHPFATWTPSGYFMRHNPSKMFFGRCGLSSNKHAQVEWVEAFPRQSWCFGALDGLSSAPGFRVRLGRPHRPGASRFGRPPQLGVRKLWRVQILRDPDPGHHTTTSGHPVVVGQIPGLSSNP